MNKASGSGALAGLTVLDLSRVLGGPFCAQILADHGARVIKVEPPQGDETRTWGPPFSEGLSAYFAGANRNKEALALDLARQEGRAVLLRLLEHADILLENFKPGTLAKWGLDYEAVLAKRFPRLIHCAITGFGEEGPLGGLPGYDAAAQAWSGVMSVNGSPETGPLRMGLPIIDLGAGLNACIGILAAVHERTRSGRGQSVRTSLFETGLALLHPHGANWFMSGQTPKPMGSAHPNISPYDLFRTRTCPIFLAVGNDGQFAKLCDRLGCADLIRDPRFLANKDRVVHRVELKSELESRLLKEDGESLAEDLLKRGVPAGPVLDIPKAFQHPQAKALGMRVNIGDVGHIAPPIRLSRTPASVRTAAPSFAADSETVLKTFGFSDADVQSLVNQGVVSSTNSGQNS